MQLNYRWISTILIVALATENVQCFTVPSPRAMAIAVPSVYNSNTPLLDSCKKSHRISNRNQSDTKLYASTETNEIGGEKIQKRKTPKKIQKRKTPKVLMNIYVNYITKLWRQTDPIEREKIAALQALSAVKNVKSIMEGQEYVDIAHVNDGETIDDVDERIAARDELLESCNKMISCLEKSKLEAPAMEIIEAKATEEKKKVTKKEKKKSRSVLFGVTMGAVVAGWVFSGNFIFTTLFTLMTGTSTTIDHYLIVFHIIHYLNLKLCSFGTA